MRAAELPRPSRYLITESIRLTNHTADHVAGSRRLVSGRPGGWRQFGDSTDWQVTMTEFVTVKIPLEIPFEDAPIYGLLFHAVFRQRCPYNPVIIRPFAYQIPLVIEHDQSPPCTFRDIQVNSIAYSGLSLQPIVT
jgi:hypothetical protein